MSNTLVMQGFQQAKKLLILQLILVIIIASFGLFKEFKIATALLSGGMAVFLGNAYFVFKAFSKSGAQQTRKVMGAFYFGEIAKIIISTSLLVVGFIVLPGFELYCLVGYIVALLSQWLAPVIVKSH